MTQISLEHVNFTVSDPKATAAWMADVFGWQTRWSGTAMNGAGETFHVGNDQQYVALYGPKQVGKNPGTNYGHANGLNHVAVVTDDLATLEAKVQSAGFETHSHASYEPGRRFYFHDHDGIEFECVSYD